jgi:hypothetical protein
MPNSRNPEVYARMSDPVLVACLSFSPRSEQGKDLRFNIAC